MYTTLEPFIGVREGEPWDNCDVNGHYLDHKYWAPCDSNGHLLREGDIVLVACLWLIHNVMQPAQVIQADGSTPVRVKPLRELRRIGAASKRIRDDDTFYISNSNILYQSNQYRDMNTEYILGLLYPGETQ